MPSHCFYVGEGRASQRARVAHCAMSEVFDGPAPSTLASILRAFSLGNLHQLAKTSRLLLPGLARRLPLLPGSVTLRVYASHMLNAVEAARCLSAGRR